MGQRILILEDDETFRKFVAMVLKAEGHDVVSVASIEEARKLIAAEPPGGALCLIIDVVLEHESGIEFAQELIQHYPTYRVLLISGFTDDILMTKPEDTARIAFLRKPFSRPDLAAELEKLCG